MPIRASERARYPKDWKAISDRIKRRARNRCECRGECGRHTKRCAARQYQPHPTTGSHVVLTVAHLNHTPEDCRDDNLKAYCQLCHLVYDARHHARNAKRTRAAKVGQAFLPGMITGD